MFTRYAIYYTLPPCPLAEFGAAWLGWDIALAKRVGHPDLDGLDISSITQVPRKYGLHGTIKPPFQLAEGTNEQALKNALALLCQDLQPVMLDRLKLTTLGRFLALCPVGDAVELNDLAAEVVKTLDGFRAPFTESEYARRCRANLSSAQKENLRNWGYHHVMDAFKFHITLTGKLDKVTLSKVVSALDPLITPMIPQPFVINSLTLVAERTDGMFVALDRYPLGATEPKSEA